MNGSLDVVWKNGQMPGLRICRVAVRGSIPAVVLNFRWQGRRIQQQQNYKTDLASVA